MTVGTVRLAMVSDKTPAINNYFEAHCVLHELPSMSHARVAAPIVHAQMGWLKHTHAAWPITRYTDAMITVHTYCGRG